MHSLLLFLLIPFAAAVAMPFASKLHRRLADGVAILASLALLGLTVCTLPKGAPEKVFELFGGHLSLDGLSALFLLVVNGISPFCLIYASKYLEHLGGRGKFYALFLILILGLNGVVLVRDLFSLYVYLEVASIAAYVLVAFGLEWDGVESALKYLLLSVAGTALILLGISLVYMKTGCLDFAGLKTALAAQAAKDPASLRFFLLPGAMFVAGFGLKAAIMPFHAWLPDAHPSAPAPVSAILSGVVIKVGGVYALTRIFLGIFPPMPQIQGIFLILGVLSMAAGAITAYFQTDMKRMLAYSSISQIGIIMIGLGIGNEWAVAGSLFHVLNHAQFKSLLFLNSGAIQFQTGTRNLEEMGGLESRMKVTGITSVFGTLSIAGVPPFNGFWSKFFVIFGALEAHRYGVAALVAVFSIFTMGYFLVLQRKAFFGQLNEKWRELKEAPAAMSLAVICLAAGCLFTGIYFQQVMDLVVFPATKALLGGN